LEATFDGMSQTESPQLNCAGNHAYIDETFGYGDVIKQEVWVTDGTVAGSGKILTSSSDGYRYLYSGNFIAVGNSAVFEAPDRPHHDALWISNGTAAGTHVFAPLDRAGSASEIIGSASLYDAACLMIATAPSIPSLWEDPRDSLWLTGGTEAKTIRVADFDNFPDPDFNSNVEVLGKHMLLEAVDYFDPDPITGEPAVALPVFEFAAEASAPAAHGVAQAFRLSGDVLEVFGALHADSIHVRRSSSDTSMMSISFNGRTETFSRHQIRKVVFYVLPSAPTGNVPD
jgi:hypothetical protein